MDHVAAGGVEHGMLDEEVLVERADVGIAVDGHAGRGFVLLGSRPAQPAALEDREMPIQDRLPRLVLLGRWGRPEEDEGQ
jgi:hypothetical protein